VAHIHWVERALVVGLLIWAAAPLASCGDCEQEIDAAREFLNDADNLRCQSDDDCSRVDTGCHTFERGLCGQGQLNKEAESSQTWRELSADLHDCGPSRCTQCTALLLPGCRDGFCGGHP
jgi:hypothetical protein